MKVPFPHFTWSSTLLTLEDCMNIITDIHIIYDVWEGIQNHTQRYGFDTDLIADYKKTNIKYTAELK